MLCNKQLDKFLSVFIFLQYCRYGRKPVCVAASFIASLFGIAQAFSVNAIMYSTMLVLNVALSSSLFAPAFTLRKLHAFIKMLDGSRNNVVSFTNYFCILYSLSVHPNSQGCTIKI